MVKPKILVLDIETAPIHGYFWGLWDQNIGLDMITEDWTILSYAAKWLGEGRVFYEDTGGRGKDFVRRDGRLLHSIRALLDEADIVVAQNGKKFDLRKINARLIQQRLPPYSPVRVIDTMLVARKVAAFTSNKLEWLGKLAGHEKGKHRKFPGFELWAECLKDNPKAWAEMRKYNVRDISVTEDVYTMLRPWIEQHPNLGLWREDRDTRHVCPNCGSHKVEGRGIRKMTAGIYQRFKCLNAKCGAWSRGKIMLNSITQRKSLLV